MRILVTGSSGFVGRYVCNAFSKNGFLVTAFSRRKNAFDSNISVVVAPSFECLVDKEYLRNFDCILHLAGRAHVLNESSLDPLAVYREVNVSETLFLAKAAAESGVRRFIFLSTVKVNGEYSSADSPFTELDIPAPSDPYSISKFEAEKALLDLGLQSGLEVVIVRPPLIYGPSVKGNLRTLIRLLSIGIPLPLASASGNQRSLISLPNLADFLMLCCRHPAASGQTFLVSDQFDVSTLGLLREIALALNVKLIVFHFPVYLVRILLFSCGKSSLYYRLFGSLVVDSSKASTVLGWTPPYTFRLGMALLR